MQRLQSTHLASSTIGAAKPSWRKAPVLHTLSEGQGWFWGHLCFNTFTANLLVSFFDTYTSICIGEFRFSFCQGCNEFIGSDAIIT